MFANHREQMETLLGPTDVALMSSLQEEQELEGSHPTPSQDASSPKPFPGERDFL